jgi:hypothetical protein
LEPLENEGNDTAGEGTSQQPDGQAQQLINAESAPQVSDDAPLQGSSQQSGSSVTIATDVLLAMANDIKQLAATVTGVSVQCQENRAEMSELRAHVTAMDKQRVSAQVISNASASYNAVNIPAPQRLVAQGSASGGVSGVSALIPSLTSLRSDPQLVSQAERLVDNMACNYAGNQVELSSSLKPGLLRQGGEQAPKVKTWWPHDFVFGFGKRYEDLDQVQWTLGYAAIVEQEPDPYISKLMLVHLQNLMQDAQFSGFEAAKYAHGMILSQLERGRFTWADTLAMSEVRRSAINAKSTELMNSVQAASASRVSKQGFVQSSSGPVSNNNSNQTFKGGRKMPKLCAYFNSKTCSHKGDHETNGILYVHSCKVCYRDHPEKECNFL